MDIEAQLRKFNALGYPDPAIAKRLGMTHWHVKKLRTKLGLPGRTHAPPANRKRWRAVKKTIGADGFKSLGGFQTIQARVEAARLGWPEDCTPSETRLLQFVYNLGSCTARRHAEATGRARRYVNRMLAQLRSKGHLAAEKKSVNLVYSLAEGVRARRRRAIDREIE